MRGTAVKEDSGHANTLICAPGSYLPRFDLSYLLLQGRQTKVSVPRTSDFPPTKQDPLSCASVLDGDMDL